MRSCNQVRLFTLLSLVIAATAQGQGTRSDYERMARLPRLTANKVFRVKVEPVWLTGGDAFWYRVQTAPKSHEFVFVDLAGKKREAAFDHERVAKQLSELTKRDVEADALPLKELRFSSDMQTVFARSGSSVYRIQRSDSQLSEAEPDDLPQQRAVDLKSLKPSVDKGPEKYLTFVNETKSRVRTIWIDRSGRRVNYETIAPGKSFRQHTFAGHVWLVEGADGAALALVEAEQGDERLVVDGKTKLNLRGRRRRRSSNGEARSNSTSPNERFRAEIRDDRLIVTDTKEKQEHELGKANRDGEQLESGRFFWSPDSRYLVAIQRRPGQERIVHLIESAPRDQTQPKLHTMSYLKPGDDIRQQRIRMFDVAQQREVELSAELAENPWRIDRFQWRADSSEFIYRFNQRGHQVMRVIGVRPSDGRTRAIIDETTKTFIDYTNKVFLRADDAADEMIWMSERDGWNHLYLYDWSKGRVKHQITKGNWVVREVDRVDPQRRQIWFQASGITPGQDPYYVHRCRIDFDGANLTLLTEGDGTHNIRYSPDQRYLIDEYSRVDLPTVTTVRNASDGTLVCELEKGDWTLLKKTGWRPAVPFAAKGRDGKTDIYGVVYLPTDFDPKKKYPVIEYIYAGPHDSFTPKRFSSHNQSRSMAELGFIVVQLDGMGTSNRSKAFHDVCWKNLGDSGFPDRILWMKAAAKKFPQMDLTRVGVYGGSAGGQSALRALLAHGDFYQAAVADCGCHDNRMDKIWWNEQWMGWPIGPHYKEQSNVTNAHKLQGDLLLIVGELDRNVDPASTMQVVDALVRADKDFDMLVIPGAGHGVGSRRYGMRRTRDFFVRRLLGVEPRREAE